MRYLSSLLLISFSSLCCGCAKQPSPWQDKPGIKVLASFPPIASMAMNVVDSEGTVLSLLNSGVHVHGDPNTQEIILAHDADVIFSNGLGLEDRFLKKIKSPAGNAKLLAVELGSRLDKKTLLEGECGHEHVPGETHDHPTDPHVWLSPVNARQFVKQMAITLNDLKGKNDRIDANAVAYCAKLDELLGYGDKLLKDKQERKFVSFHDSLQYFVRDFKLEIAGVVEIEPGVEPGSKQMAELIENCTKNKIRVIAVEPQFTAKNAATTIRNELKHHGIDAVFVEIDPLETATEITPELYIDTMRKNLENLAAALK